MLFTIDTIKSDNPFSFPINRAADHPTGLKPPTRANHST